MPNFFLFQLFAPNGVRLLLDDFKDLEDDRRDNDENVIIELGNNKEAILKAYEIGENDLVTLGEMNPKLSKFIKTFLKQTLEYDYIAKELA